MEGLEVWCLCGLCDAADVNISVCVEEALILHRNVTEKGWGEGGRIGSRKKEQQQETRATRANKKRGGGGGDGCEPLRFSERITRRTGLSGES